MIIRDKPITEEQTLDEANAQNLEFQENPETTKPDMPRSRLKNSLEKKTKQQIFLMVLGMFAIVGLLAFFAVPILVNYGVLLNKIKGSEEATTNEESTSFVAAPILTQDFTATNSAKVTIEGSAGSMQTIKLYVNDELADKISAKKDGSFIARSVKLTEGDNTIKAKAVDEKEQESGFSNPINIIVKNKPPELSIDFPADNQIITTEENKVMVTGKTDPNVQVTVNGFWAIVDENGNYKYNLTINGGDNSLKVVATDKAGNKKEMERKVIYNR